MHQEKTRSHVFAPNYDRDAGRQSHLTMLWVGLQPASNSHIVKRNVQLAIKRVLDPLLALLGLILLAPVLMLIACAIVMTDPGPALFSQWREGRNGVPFRIWKFRTMYHHLGDAAGIRQVRTNDARITPLGRFLRRYSLDELPQLYNILLGEMSLVGPRPHPLGMLAGGRRYDELVPYYRLRRAIRPGLTGWAQCNGLRGSTEDAASARARIDHDLAYIQNFSLLLDLRIIVRTVIREWPAGTGL